VSAWGRVGVGAYAECSCLAVMEGGTGADAVRIERRESRSRLGTGRKVKRPALL
jgi:hypothetical protein